MWELITSINLKRFCTFGSIIKENLWESTFADHYYKRIFNISRMQNICIVIWVEFLNGKWREIFERASGSLGCKINIYKSYTVVTVEASTVKQHMINNRMYRRRSTSLIMVCRGGLRQLNRYGTLMDQAASQRHYRHCVPDPTGQTTLRVDTPNGALLLRIFTRFIWPACRNERANFLRNSCFLKRHLFL